MSLKEMFKAQTSNPENKGYTTFPDTVRPSINPDLIPDGLKPSKPVFPRDTVPFVPSGNVSDIDPEFAVETSPENVNPIAPNIRPDTMPNSADTLPQRIYPTEPDVRPDIMPDPADTLPRNTELTEPDSEGPGKRRPWSVESSIARGTIESLDEGLVDDNPAIRQAFYIELYKQLEAEKQALKNGTSDKDFNSSETDDMKSIRDIVNDTEDLTIDTYADYAKAAAGAIVNGSLDERQAINVLDEMQYEIANRYGFEHNGRYETDKSISPEPAVSAGTAVNFDCKTRLEDSIRKIAAGVQDLSKGSVSREAMADEIAPAVSDGESPSFDL